MSVDGVDGNEALDLAGKVARIDEHRAELREALQALEAERKELEVKLIDLMTAATVQSIKAAGRTVYLRLQTWVKPRDADRAAAVQAAQTCGYGDAVTVNTQRMSALAREAGGVHMLPPEIQAAFEETESVSIRTRRS